MFKQTPLTHFMFLQVTFHRSEVQVSVLPLIIYQTGQCALAVPGECFSQIFQG